jgi:formylglycine-generating enzyme required for sulfatase activity
VKSSELLVCIFSAVCCLPAAESKPDEPEKPVPTTVDPMLGKKAGEVRDDNGLKMKLVWCSPGIFRMGSANRVGDDVEVVEQHVPMDDDETDGEEPEFETIVNEIPAVNVFLRRGYWLGRYEVTQAEWKQVTATELWKGKRFAKEGDDLPAAYVSWNDAMKFCSKLTEQERQASRLPDGWEYTLPTEAQWERACRARTETVFSFGDDESQLGEYAWFEENALMANEPYAHRVGQKEPNPWGLHDMHGNVWEWCRDFYAEKLPGGIDPQVTEKASHRVARGGSWRHDASLCHSAFRGRSPPGVRAGRIGFRVALSSVQTVK